MHLRWMLNPMLGLTPGVKDQKVTLTSTFHQDVTLYSVMPHMHLRGISARYELTYPDGTTAQASASCTWSTTLRFPRSPKSSVAREQGCRGTSTRPRGPGSER